jgi:hypothetical protein
MIGEHVQCHLGGHARQRLRYEVGCSHPGLGRAEGMLDRLTARVISGGAGPSPTRQIKLNKRTLTPRTARLSFVQKSTLWKLPLPPSRPMRSGFRSGEPDRPTPDRWQVSFKVRTGKK